MKYELTVDAKGNWAICEEGAGDVIADLMTKEVAQKLCDLLRADDIEDVLNDVFARNMPFLSTQLIGDIDEELGMGFGKDGTIILPNETNYVDCQNKELEDVYLPPSYPRPFVKPRTTKEYNKMVDDHITERINKVKPFDGMDAETVYNKLKKIGEGEKGETKLKKSLKRLTNHVYREYGVRCDEYEPTCIVCRTWEVLDDLKETIKPKGEKS